MLKSQTYYFPQREDDDVPFFSSCCCHKGQFYEQYLL